LREPGIQQPLDTRVWIPASVLRTYPGMMGWTAPDGIISATLVV
jgi:hypothetical protein